jgi:hypothetical protein
MGSLCSAAFRIKFLKRSFSVRIIAARHLQQISQRKCKLLGPMIFGPACENNTWIHGEKKLSLFNKIYLWMTWFVSIHFRKIWLRWSLVIIPLRRTTWFLTSTNPSGYKIKNIYLRENPGVSSCRKQVITTKIIYIHNHG